MTDTPHEEAPSRTDMDHEGLSRKPSALLVRLLRRVVLDCTLDELAERTTVHADLISRYERGKVTPRPEHLNTLLRTAGLLGTRRSLQLAIEQIAELVNPVPPIRPPASDPLLIRELLGDAARRVILLDSSGEGRMPAPALLVQFVRKVLLGCTLRKLSDLTGIHENLLVRYEGGGVEQPSPENLDLILEAAGLRNVRKPLLQAMSDLAGVLAREAADSIPEDLMDPGEIDALVQNSIELLRRNLREE